ncbi:SulP family inorganic anion transporter [Paracoccus sp. S-4012]|uniref:SulP family inorganic anion transporter n=1 Tax=Paracoccus sp. S-4012 TaxID=2665648 RepID=UPI0012AF70D5|nr:SulP family inorganic anion transporter [Paracoccus sp. S-4012]MRX50044.1 SulP family inorganic anion transporter [Paracoccus sp. S-4012]
MLTPKLLTTLRTYDRQQFTADLFAGLTVAMVAVPLSLAIAIASGVPPGAGLVTAAVAGFLISALGGSRVQVGGPTGAFIVVVAGVVATYGQDGLILATLMAGVILIIAGLMRAGGLIEYVPEPVINGFTVGIAIIIAASQLGDLMGLHPAGPVPAEFIPKIGALWEARATVSPASFGVGVVTIALIVALRRAFPRLPGLIVAVGLTSAAAVILGLPVDTIESRFGALPDRLPMPALPEMSYARLRELLPSALVIAFLAGIESLLSALVADRMIDGRHRPNAEVLAQGCANIGSALFGGLPATGAIARTATNVRAGARTPMAGIFHALAVLAVMMFGGPLAGQLAMPALAGVLVLTAWNMSEPAKWRGWMRTRTGDRVLLVMTMLLTVLADLTVAIGVGVIVGLALRLGRRDVRSDWTPPQR